MIPPPPLGGPPRSGSSLALLFADGRFPAGGHAHSGGVEDAVDASVVVDLSTLADYLAGRLAAAGVLAAAVAALVCEQAPSADRGERRDLWAALDAEIDARMPSAPLRRVSRRQGSSLLTAAEQVSPHRLLDSLRTATDGRPHHPVALGAQGAVGGLTPFEVATAAAYGSVAGPATAAVRLLGLDPLGVTRVLADLAPALDAAALAASASAAGAPRALPSPAAPGTDLLAARRLDRREHLFAS